MSMFAEKSPEGWTSGSAVRKGVIQNTLLPFWESHLSVPLPVLPTILSEVKSTVRAELH